MMVAFVKFFAVCGIVQVLGVSLCVGAVDDDYLKAIQQHASGAAQAKDVSQLIEAAYALYPIERGKEKSDAQYSALLNQAADLSLKAGTPDAAAAFLDSAGAIVQCIDATKLKALEDAARGGTPTEAVRDTVNADVARSTTRYGKQFGDADNKTQVRGDAEEEAAEAIAISVLAFMRPSVILADKEPRLVSHSWTSPNSGRKRLEAKIQYFGAMTSDSYTASVRVEFLLDGGFEVLRIGYSDDNLLPCYNLRNVDELIDLLNDAFGNQ